MTRDHRDGRLPFTQYADQASPLGAQPQDSAGAQARGKDQSHPDEFDTDGFATFGALPGAAGPGGRQPQALFVVKTPGATYAAGLITNDSALNSVIVETTLVAGADGPTVGTLADAEIKTVGGPAGLGGIFSEISQIYVYPSVQDPAPKVARMVSPTGVIDVGVWKGLIQFHVYGCKQVDTNPSIPIRWFVESSATGTGGWTLFAELGTETFRAVESPECVHYRTRPLLQLTTRTYYQIRTKRIGAGPLMTLTMTDPTIEVIMKIQRS